MDENENHMPLWALIIIFIFIIGAIGCILIISFGDRSWFTALAYLIAASAIAGGGCVAYHHLQILRGTERAAVLTNLDTTWMGTQLQSSRNAFLKFKNTLPRLRKGRKRDKYIKDRLRNLKAQRHEDYRELLRMVDFLETVGYFCRVGYILSTDAIELYGPSIRENNETFRPHIIELQRKAKDKSIYANFLWLADKTPPKSI